MNFFVIGCGRVGSELALRLFHEIGKFLHLRRCLRRKQGNVHIEPPLALQVHFQ